MGKKQHKHGLKVQEYLCRYGRDPTLNLQDNKHDAINSGIN